MTTISPETSRRAGYTKGLRALADILDAHPELPLPYHGDVAELDWIEVDENARRHAAVFARVMPGTVAKSVSDGAGQFYLKFKLHGLSLRVISTRAQMCERVVTGTRTVVIEEPDPEALALVPKVTRTEVVEDVEWQCRPVLATEQVPA
ncbi:hypothetical protein ACQP2T_63725 (plasmid) [Nonomuraea sp. CA-143628]|uniref:hypothetical protein n=1 Tax=Nonomuraea sp. CA-143628 TaxID=3239997 RepID=UPI003D89E701